MEQATETTATLTCETHGEYTGTVRRTLSGKNYGGVCPKCNDERAALWAELEAKHAAEQVRRAIETKRAACRIPARFAQASFAQYEASGETQRRALKCSKAFADHFDKMRERGASLTYMGNPGTGKTHLACAVGNALLDAGRVVLYRTAYGLLREIKATWGGDAGKSEAEVIRTFCRADLLILDEIGVQFGTDVERVLLFDVINARYADLKPMVIVSNLDERGLVEYLGERIFDRLAENGSAVVAFDWKSYRRR